MSFSVCLVAHHCTKFHKFRLSSRFFLSVFLEFCIVYGQLMNRLFYGSICHFNIIQQNGTALKNFLTFKIIFKCILCMFCFFTCNTHNPYSKKIYLVQLDCRLIQFSNQKFKFHYIILLLYVITKAFLLLPAVIKSCQEYLLML